MIHQLLALVTAQQQLPDVGGGLWSYIRDQAKQFWYIGLVIAGIFYLLSKSREGTGHLVAKVIAAGGLVFAAPAIGAFIGNAWQYVLHFRG
jgi:hypothetical protein